MHVLNVVDGAAQVVKSSEENQIVEVGKVVLGLATSHTSK